MLEVVIDTPSGPSNGYDAAMLQSSSFSRCSTWVALAAATWFFASHGAHAQDVADGSLLVASAELEDPNFSRTVILVLRHDQNGTVGVVINRPTNLVPATVFPEVAAGLGQYSGRLYRGGPVSPARLLFLVRGLAAATVNGPEVLEKVFLSADPETLGDITRLANGTDELRLYAGHAEWQPDQLKQEISAGGWTVVTGDADTVFSTEPGELWERLSAGGASGGVVAGTRAAKPEPNAQPVAAERMRGSWSRSALR